MYKVLIAEDEADVREAIATGLDWAGHGFQVMETAENGQEAWEQFERHQPDVLFTDIKMPFMDGLQLADLVKRQAPGTKIIILSGYDEFEYAQKALKLQVDEYVLKPFSTEELVQVLKKVRHQLDEEAAEKKNVASLMEHYRRSLPVLQAGFLASLLMGQPKKRELEEKSSLYQIDLEGQGFQVSVISLDLTPDKKESGSLSLKDSEDQELKLFAVLNIAEEIVTDHQLGRVFLHNGHVVVLTIDRSSQPNQPDQPDQPSQPAETEVSPKSEPAGPFVTTNTRRTVQALEEIRQAVERYLKLTVTIGVGVGIKEASRLSYSYKDAVLALDYRVILGGNRVIQIEDVESRSAEKVRFDDLQEETLVRCLKVGTANELREIIDQLFTGVASASVSVKEYQLYLMEILTAMLKAAKDADADLDEVFGANVAPFAALSQFQTMEEAKAWFTTIGTQMMGSIAVVRQSSHKNLVEEAISYTRAHYMDSELSIHKVCQHLHISTGYFSSIFKKETKLTFVTYLLHIRMEAAKELLRTTDLKAFEIAERVGYTEPNYFSFSFKKFVGMSPKEYRSSLREG